MTVRHNWKQFKTEFPLCRIPIHEHTHQTESTFVEDLSSRLFHINCTSSHFLDVLGSLGLFLISMKTGLLKPVIGAHGQCCDITLD